MKWSSIMVSLCAIFANIGNKKRLVIQKFTCQRKEKWGGKTPLGSIFVTATFPRSATPNTNFANANFASKTNCCLHSHILVMQCVYAVCLIVKLGTYTSFPNNPALTESCGAERRGFSTSLAPVVTHDLLMSSQPAGCSVWSQGWTDHVLTTLNGFSNHCRWTSWVRKFPFLVVCSHF